MVRLLFIRHGKPEFDPVDRATLTLGPEGREQARLLGDYLASAEENFSSLATGTLERHRSTAQCLREAYTKRGLTLPEAVEDPRLDEIDDHALYSDFLAVLREHPRLAEERDCLEETLAHWQGDEHRREDTRKKLHDLNLFVSNIMAVEWTRDRGAHRAVPYRTMQRHMDAWLADVSASTDLDRTMLVVSSRFPISLCVGRLRGTSPERTVTLPLFHTSVTEVQLSASGSGTVLHCNRIPHLLSRPDLWSQL